MKKTKPNKPQKKGEKFATFLVQVQKYLDWRFSSFLSPNVIDVLRNDIVQELHLISLNTDLMSKKDIDDSITYARKQAERMTKKEKFQKLKSQDNVIDIRDIKRRSNDSIH
tara:strand:- start:652 stop:984 length:333 start_codon:yes stop_codon:yes gene_type:complete